MKKLFSLTILFFVLSFAFPAFSFAQGMPALSEVEGMENNMMSGSNPITQSDDSHTAREESEGKEIWEKLSAKGGSASGGQAEELKCENLSDENFGSLGEYFMGQMAGEQHEAMNNMMIQMMGSDGEKQMHIVLGKRMSNCEPNAPIPQNMPALSGVEGMNSGMIPMMMNMMMGGGNSMMGNFATNPTGWFGWGFSWIFMILFWGFIILAIVVLIKWIMNQGKHDAKSKFALDILKERYAKGEIDKKEFEEKSREIKNL